MLNLGMVRPGRTLYVPFESFDGGTGASITMTGIAVTDIEIYKNGSVTQRASDTGYTLLDTDGIDFDGITGIHGFSIDLASNATADFFTAGGQYWVVVSSVTIDAQTVNFVAAYFTIGYPEAVINTTIATLSTQTSFTLTDGPAEDDALNGMWAIIHDIASAVQLAKVLILDYTGSTKTVTLAAGATFTAAAGDNISIMGPAPLQPTTTGRALDVSTGGEAGVDWANVGSPTTAQNLSGTNIATNQAVASVSGAVGSVTGAVGSVTGAVGSVTGAVGSVTGAVGSVTAAVTVGTNNDKTGYALSSAAVQAIWDALTSALTTVGSIGKLIVDNLNATLSSRSSHSAADVWAAGTRTLTAGTNIALAKGTGVTGFNDLDAAGVRTAVGLAAANLDTQFDAIPTATENATQILASAVADPIAANVEEVNGVALQGVGTTGDPWRPA